MLRLRLRVPTPESTLDDDHVAHHHRDYDSDDDEYADVTKWDLHFSIWDEHHDQ